MTEIITVGGVKGVGKTTALDYLRQSYGFSIIHISFELNRFALERTGNAISGLPRHLKREVRDDYGKSLAKQLRTHNVRTYVDLHYTDVREDPDEVLHPDEFLREVSIFSIIQAPAEVVRTRRSLDLTRTRNEAQDLIAEIQSEFNCSKKLATKYKKRLAEIDGSRNIQSVAASLAELSFH
jgi:adenylate kinase